MSKCTSSPAKQAPTFDARGDNVRYNRSGQIKPGRWPSPMKTFGCLLLILCAAIANGAEPRWNVLFICSDDLRPELGCYGVSEIKTPHIDALAARSVRFNRAYAQFPLCGPSRASMLTGRYPTTTKIMDNTRWVGGLFPEWKTLLRFFRDNGYETRRAGKIFHGDLDDNDAWMEGGEKRAFEGI